ncbi:F0F1 ATP synthase subunit B family protein [Qipengyuania sp. CAU 1752]
MANTPEVIATEAAQVSTKTGIGAPVHVDPTAFGLEPYQWVSVAMLVLILVFVWKKVPALVTGGLDSKIAEIKAQLDEAKTLRAEAEKLRDEYSAKIANAEKDAEAMVENARHEADALLAKAEADSQALVERRKKMAEDKISAAERDAVDQVRAAAAAGAATASRKLIAEKHDADADRALADEVISNL